MAADVNYSVFAVGIDSFVGLDNVAAVPSI
jgi:hypothetical protein